ncbi:MAG TPA: ribosome maturation factor RimP [Gammaproteobacteria bacterium]
MVDKRGLFEMLEPPLRSLGYELVDLEVTYGRKGLLRLYIDKEGGVTLGDCELVGVQIGAFLDVEDPLPGSYVLEVSSPGFDRKLRTAEHFRRFVNDDVRIELIRPRDGRRRLKGRIKDVQDNTVTVEVDGVDWRVDLPEIGVARLVPQK